MKTKTSTQNFSCFAGELINELIAAGRYGTAGTYRNALNSLTAYFRTIGRKDLRICDIAPSFVAGYNDSIHSRAMLRNSISFYNRTLRAIYNKAVRKWGQVQNYVFEKVIHYSSVELLKELCQ